MKETNALTKLDLKKIFTGTDLKTFIIGAGCSIDPPSCLPSAKTMMEALIQYFCPKSEITRITNLFSLIRFESLVEIFQDNIDPDLKLLDYYNLCGKPNIIHFFLADMIMKGNFILTTNFDLLIEHALLQLGVKEEEIIPVITRKDYQKYSNAKEWFSRGKKLIIKLHGSSKNLITGENTKDTLISTIEEFGKNKEGLNIFQLEPFKRPIFENSSKDRTLIVMGYSGSDDFDIIPTLEALQIFRKIIWINHQEKHGFLNIRKITNKNQENKKDDKLNKILFTLKQRNIDIDVFRIDTNISELIKRTWDGKYKLQESNQQKSIEEWLEKHFETPIDIERLDFACGIYSLLDLYAEQLKCEKKVLNLAQNSGDLKKLAESYIGIGNIYDETDKTTEALKLYKNALDIYTKIQDNEGKIIVLINLGALHSDQNELSEALKYYKQALQISETIEEKRIKSKPAILTNIGVINYKKRNYSEAIKYYRRAIELFDRLGGGLTGKAANFSNLGQVYHAQKNYAEGIKYYLAAFNIYGELLDFDGMGICSKNLALIYLEAGDFSAAIDLYENNLKLFIYLKDEQGIVETLNDIAKIYHDLGRYSEALMFYRQALRIVDKRGDLEGRCVLCYNIGEIYEAQGKKDDALKFFTDALSIAGQINYLEGFIALVNKLGGFFIAQNSLHRALEIYVQGLNLLESNNMGQTPPAVSFRDQIAKLKDKS